LDYQVEEGKRERKCLKIYNSLTLLFGRMRPDVIYSFLPPKNNPFNPKFQITLPILPPNQTVASLTNIWGQKVWK